MHLRAPAFIRYLGGNPYPRITVTHKPSQREADWAYGPFASRAAAERFAEEALKLFLLRRCTDDLNPDPSHPGCVYSEMKMCLAPCYKGCTDDRYAEESAAVQDFLATRGESKLVVLRGERGAASAELEFEKAAALHAQVQKVEAVRALAPELVQPMSRLRALVLQASAPPAVGPIGPAAEGPAAPAAEVAVFLYQQGRIRGPVMFSTLGMRIQNEQSGSSSLFAQPMALEAVPETGTRESGNREQGTDDRCFGIDVNERSCAGETSPRRTRGAFGGSTAQAGGAVPRRGAERSRSPRAPGVVEALVLSAGGEARGRSILRRC